MAAFSNEDKYALYNNASTSVRSNFHSPKSTIQWTVEDFCDIGRKQTDFVESPKFYFEDTKASWWLRVFPYGKQMVIKGVKSWYVSVYVHTNFSNTNAVKIGLFVIGCKQVRTIDFNGQTAVCEDLVARDFLKSYLVDDSLTFGCNIKILDKGSHFHCGKSKKNTLESSKLPNDLKKILDDSLFSDVTLIVTQEPGLVQNSQKSSQAKKTFKLHRNILAARSKVFAAMLTHDMKEGKTSTIIVTDVDVKVMEEVISYIYTGNCPRLKALVADILPVAEKYDLDYLKCLCGEELYSQLTAENAPQTLAIAELYNLVHLKEEVMDFISGNAKSVMGSPLWIEFEKRYEQLAVKIIKHTVKKQICGSS